MGVDCDFYVLSSVPFDEEVIRGVQTRLRDHLADPLVELVHARGPVLWAGDETYAMKMGTTMRYWGIGYECGPLPKILFMLEVLSHAFPRASVWYGADTGGDPELWNEKLKRKLITHLLGPDWNEYRVESQKIIDSHNAEAALFRKDEK